MATPTPDSYIFTPGTTLYAGLPTPSGGLITTLSLVNTSGSTQASNFISKMIALPFKQGDLPAGKYPVLTLEDDTPCPATFWSESTWPDGSMRICGTMYRVPTSIAGSGTLTVNVKGGGSAPASSAMTTSTVSGATDLKVTANALRNWTAGEWEANLNAGITAGDVEVLGSGPAGIVFKVYRGFRQGGSNHGQAGVWFYVAALQNSVGGLYGIRCFERLHNGWHDITSPAINVLAMDALALKNGGTTIRTVASSFATRTFTWSSGISVTTTGYVSGMPVRLTTTGTLPAGLSLDTAYFLRVVSGSVATLHTTMAQGRSGASPVTITDAGSGTHTITPVQHVDAYAQGPALVGSTGEWDFIQAGGTGSECTVEHRVAPGYVISTRVLGPIDRSVTVTTPTIRNYTFDGWVDLTIFQDTSGGRPEIGWLSGWCVNEFITGVGLQTVRVHSLQQMNKTLAVRREATKRCLNLTNSTYSTLGASMTTYRMAPSNTAGNVGVNAPTDYGRIYGVQDWAHQPHMQAYAYLRTGEPQYLDMLMEVASSAVASAGNRVQTIGATTYHGVLMADQQQRVSAWQLRDVAFAQMFAPDAWEEKAAFAEIFASNLDYLKAEKLSGSAFARDNGIFPAKQTERYIGNWQLAYMLSALNLNYASTGDPDAATAIDEIILGYEAIRAQFGLHAVSSFYQWYSVTPKNVTSWDEVVFRSAMGSMTWDAATDVFTCTPATGYGTLTNDGVVQFGTGWAPAGLTAITSYFCRDVSGNTFKLAATRGGSVIDITANGSVSGDLSAGVPGGAMSNTTMASGLGSSSYPVLMLGMMRWSKALGRTLPTGLETGMETYRATGSVTWGLDSSNALLNTFEVA